ncbi:MAG: hypothetical protein ABJA86_03410 [Nocardioidaceae bacterium]
MQHSTGDDGSQPGPERIAEADPADVADQHQAVDPEFEPDAPDPVDPPLEAESADVAEQRLEVPLLDEDDLR